MEAKKKIFIGSLILSLFVAVISTIVVIHRGDFMSRRSTFTFTDFARLIENEDYENLQLTIYFRSHSFLPSRASIDVERLITLYSYSENVDRFVIDGSYLSKHRELLYQLGEVELMPTEYRRRHLDIRIYYVFENRRTGDKFDVATQLGRDRNMFVNGVEVERNEFLFDVIIPFLSEDAVESLEVALGRRRVYSD